MNSMLRKTAIAAAVAGVLCAGSALAAEGIKFNPTGAGGGFDTLNTFNWVNDTALLQLAFNGPGIGAVTSGDTFIQSGAFLYGQGVLTSAGGGTIADGSKYNNTFTYEYRVPVVVTTTVGTVNGSSQAKITAVTVDNRSGADYGTNNYFRIYYSPAGVSNAQKTTGDGFGTSEGGAATAGQKLILEGKITVDAANTGFVTGDAQDTGANIGDTGTTTQGVNTIKTIAGLGSIKLDVEQCSAQNVLDGLPQCAATTTIDTNFFKSDIEGLTVDLNINPQMSPKFASGTIVPAKIVNQLFNFGGPVAGTVRNNLSCEGGTTPCDMIFDGAGAATHFFGEFVPEPGSLALLGLGIGALGGFVRRKRKTSSAS